MKRFIAIALVLTLLFCFTTSTALSPGSAGDPLASLSYINNVYTPNVRSACSAVINDTIGQAFASAEQKIQASYDAYMLPLEAYTGYTFAGALTQISLPAGTMTKLLTGGMFILTAGTATVTIEKGTVINISTGTEIASGSVIVPNQRYLCAEDTAAQFDASSSALCLVDGFYQTTGLAVVKLASFNDVMSTDWFYTAAKYALDNKLFNGTAPTTFSPMMSMSRGMFVTVLYRLAGSPLLTAMSVFSDVTEDEYYSDAVNWASTNGIVTGFDGKFSPNALITREQMALILNRYAAFAGYAVFYSNTDFYDAFPDKDSVSVYAADAVKWAVFNGLINGSNGLLLPGSTASRAEVAQIIMNFRQKVVGGNPTAT